MSSSLRHPGRGKERRPGEAAAAHGSHRAGQAGLTPCRACGGACHTDGVRGASTPGICPRPATHPEAASMLSRSLFSLPSGSAVLFASLACAAAPPVPPVAPIPVALPASTGKPSPPRPAASASTPALVAMVQEDAPHFAAQTTSVTETTSVAPALAPAASLAAARIVLVDDLPYRPTHLHARELRRARPLPRQEARPPRQALPSRPGHRRRRPRHARRYRRNGPPANGAERRLLALPSLLRRGTAPRPEPVGEGGARRERRGLWRGRAGKPRFERHQG